MEYYAEMMKEVQDALDRKDYEEASFLIKREMRMPYIPEEVEKRLKEYADRLKYELSEQEMDEKELSLEQCLRMLKGKSASQLRGAYGLMDRNLRCCLPQIKDWLSKDPCVEAAALIVDALAQQQIDEEFIWIKNGVEYTFDGDVVVPVEKSEGFHYALKKLQEELLHEPALLKMAKDTLIHEAYVMLPLSIDLMEADDLVHGIVEEVRAAMEREYEGTEVCS